MMTEISVRYIVDDVDAAVDFYTRHFQFEVSMRPGPGFAMLRRGDLRLLLNSPGGGGGAGQTLADEHIAGHHLDLEAVQARWLVQADLIAADTGLGLAWARLGRAIGSYEAMIQ